MPHQINTNICTGCEVCISACPVDAIVKMNEKMQINPNECIDCQTCWRICPSKCISGGPKEFLELKTA